MEKLSTIQKMENLNQVLRRDAEGAGGACHLYRVQREIFPVGEQKQIILIADIQFQHGRRYEEKSTQGVLDCDLLEIVRDRLMAFQSGEFATRENACALAHIEEALMWMNRRVEDRIERKVLGTYNK